jgi:putative flippase GtrA
MLTKVRHIILNIIDYFHKPFARWINLQTFRYLACGGSNTVLDIFLYFIAYNFILVKQPVHVQALTISPYIAAFMMSFSISFPSGFILSRYIVFPESTVMRKRIQILRYALLVGMCIILNYVFLKLFVEYFHFYPTPSKVLTTLIVAVFSYVAQRNFTFKVKQEMEAIPEQI